MQNLTQIYYRIQEYCESDGGLQTPAHRPPWKSNIKHSFFSTTGRAWRGSRRDLGGEILNVPITNADESRHGSVDRTGLQVIRTLYTVTQRCNPYTGTSLYDLSGSCSIVTIATNNRARSPQRRRGHPGNRDQKQVEPLTGNKCRNSFGFALPRVLTAASHPAHGSLQSPEFLLMRQFGGLDVILVSSNCCRVSLQVLTHPCRRWVMVLKAKNRIVLHHGVHHVR